MEVITSLVRFIGVLIVSSVLFWFVIYFFYVLFTGSMDYYAIDENVRVVLGLVILAASFSTAVVGSNEL
jgi:uncharacterized membrane-anchored protein